MDDAEPKARQACINCRRQKMKCRIDSGNTCRRCRRAGLPCVFVPRANASAFVVPSSLAGSFALGDVVPADTTRDLLRRVKAIEDHLGLSGQPPTLDDMADMLRPPDDGLADDGALSALWTATARLEKIAPLPRVDRLWTRSTIKHLWQTFNETMPPFHFLPKKLQFSSPQPLLLASILYCASARGAPDMADMAPQYFAVLCHAIAQLSIPGSDIGQPPPPPPPRPPAEGSTPVPPGYPPSEEWAFQTVLGLVLGGLLAEANTQQTGIWIAIAYRLMVEYCPPHIDEKYRDWRKLFKGVQIVDLEHASLHMLSPAIPIDPPLPVLRTSQRDQLYRLSRIMHAGLTHFSGRGLPSIWSYFTEDENSNGRLSMSPAGTVGGAGAGGGGAGPTPASSAGTAGTVVVAGPAVPFTEVDAAVIRDWARQLDDWLVQFSKASAAVGDDVSDQQRKTVFRQYILHRLVVLSIYHPARGFDLHARSSTPQEQRELLLSARATLKLHLDDKSIWSNWDLVIITWAALIVLQAVEGGSGEDDDLRNIRIHLDMLRQTNEPRPSLRDRLATRLEQSLQGIQTPVANPLQDAMTLAQMSQMTPDLDYSWQIFSQTSLEQVLYQDWAGPDMTM